MLFDEVLEAVRRRGLVPAHVPVVLMVSGGSDSVALARLMMELAQPLGIDEMCMLHVNHGIRGEEADGDERFVKALADELGLPCEVRHVDVPALCARERGNAEGIGRRERYRHAHLLLSELCGRRGLAEDAGRILTAHTADDRVETFIMRSIVGTGPGGLASIPWQAGCVSRPLLGIMRERLRSYLEQDTDPVPGFAQERWREDATNDDESRFRAFVRKRIVPEGLVFNPAFKQNLCRTMDLIADEDEMLQAQVRELADELVVHETDGSVSIGRDALRGLPRAMARRLLRMTVLSLLGDDARLDGAPIERVLDACVRPGFSLTLPEGIEVRDEGGLLVFLPRGAHDACQLSGGWLSIPGSLDCGPAGVLHASEAPDDAEPYSDDRDVVLVDLAGRGRVWVRFPEPGDRMRPFGLGGHAKKLSDLLVDAKVPRRKRPLVPVVCTDDRPDADVVWLAGIRLDERFKVTPHTARRVQLVLHRR